MIISHNPTGIACNECQAGMLHVIYITYFTWLDNELVMVPAFPAWVCDVCGKRDYDESAVSWMKTLLSPNAGSSPVHKAPKRRSGTIKKGDPRPASHEKE